MPPTRFPAMMGKQLAPSEIESWILELIEQKWTANEREVVALGSQSEEWLRRTLLTTRERVTDFERKMASTSHHPLDALLRAAIDDQRT